MEKTISELIEEETEKRLEIMAQPDYEFPETMKKIDVVCIVCAILVSIALIVGCFIGVL